MKNQAEKDQLEYLNLLEQMENELKYNQSKFLFPAEGQYSRDKYPQAIKFMAAGKEHSQRLFSGGNRVGKTLTGAFEMACHLTGEYPDWWEGRVFLNPVKAWAAGVTNQSTKEIIQDALLGPINDMGSGTIPRDKIVGNPTKKPGVADAIESIRVQHKSGGISELIFKSYDQKRDAFQGTYKHVIWMDEEPRDQGIYEECLMRTMNAVNPGLVYMTFTPLFGLSKVVTSFLQGGKYPKDYINPKDPDKFVISVGWDEVPHLSTEEKEKRLKGMSPHLRDARTKGLPNLGAGVVYPYPEDDLVVTPFQIPEYWPKAYGLDVGWNRTAAVWVAMDPDSKVYYLYSEHYEGMAPPAVHSSAIRARGKWMVGAVDPGSRATSQMDGRCLFNEYIEEGLDLELADNAIEAGILKCQQLFASGRLKIFSTLSNWLEEFRLYRRDENGKIEAKQDDHLMDATRYLVMACPDILTVEPDPMSYTKEISVARDEFTGY